MIKSIEIYNSGIIVIEGRLDQEYYDYTTGEEKFSYDRIAEIVCDTKVKLGISGDMETYLSEVVQAKDGKACRYLMIVANGFKRAYVKDQEFQKDLDHLATCLAASLITAGEYQIRLINGGLGIIIPNISA